MKKKEIIDRLVAWRSPINPDKIFSINQIEFIWKLIKEINNTQIPNITNKESK